MLYTQTLEKLHALRLTGMVQALEEQRQQPDIVRLDFEETIGPAGRTSVALEGEPRILHAAEKCPTQNQQCHSGGSLTTVLPGGSSERRSSNCALPSGFRTIGIV